MQEDSNKMMPFFSLTKPRSKALAKRLRSQKGLDDLDDDGSSSEWTESTQNAKKSVITEDSKRQPSAKSQNVRGKDIIGKRDNVSSGGKSRTKEECHMCQKMVNECNIASCSIEQCNKHYCIICIQENYQKVIMTLL